MPAPEARALVDRCLGPQGGRYGPLLAFLVATGLRISEALALTPADVVGGVVLVQRRLQSRDEIAAPLKTARSRRAVPIHHVARRALDLQLLALAADRAQRAYQDRGLLFPAESGLAAVPRNVQRALDAHLDALSLGHYSLHDLRRTFGTMLARERTPANVLQALMGHESISTTLAHYSSVFDGDAQAAVAGLDHLGPPLDL